MPSWLTEVLKLLGFTTPFVYAAATYGAFHWLDKKASGAAKRALTARLQSRPPNKETLANFALEVFDRIYSKPLWHVRAFCRSAFITMALCAVIWIEAAVIAIKPMDLFLITSSLFINICADYISLFFIRKLLDAARQRPALGLIISFVVGAAVVYISFVLRGIIFIYFAFKDLFFDIFSGFVGGPSMLFNPFQGVLLKQQELSAPALAVHLWLPLFALAIGLTQALGWFFKAVGWMQWFIKQGQHHPFQAVGYVASLIVFICGVVIQYAWR